MTLTLNGVVRADSDGTRDEAVAVRNDHAARPSSVVAPFFQRSASDQTGRGAPSRPDLRPILFIPTMRCMCGAVRLGTGRCPRCGVLVTAENDLAHAHKLPIFERTV